MYYCIIIGLTNIMVECGICFRKLPLESVSYLDCNHPFCVQCIAIWSSSYNSNHNACPTCRVPYLVSREQRSSRVLLGSVLIKNIARTMFLSKKISVLTIQKWYRNTIF